MSKPGYIYFLTNESLEGKLKIGMTQRFPNERAKELSATTSIPTPFRVAYASYFYDCSRVEAYIHKKLEEYRVADNREFFRIELIEIKKLMIEVNEKFGGSPGIWGNEESTDIDGSSESSLLSDTFTNLNEANLLRDNWTIDDLFDKEIKFLRYYLNKKFEEGRIFETFITGGGEAIRQLKERVLIQPYLRNTLLKDCTEELERAKKSYSGSPSKRQYLATRYWEEVVEELKHGTFPEWPYES